MRRRRTLLHDLWIAEVCTYIHTYLHSPWASHTEVAHVTEVTCPLSRLYSSGTSRVLNCHVSRCRRRGLAHPQSAEQANAGTTGLALVSLALAAQRAVSISLRSWRGDERIDWLTGMTLALPTYVDVTIPIYLPMRLRMICG